MRKNTRITTEEEIQDRLDHYNIPDDLPLVVQISHFDPWKDPERVIGAFNLARKEIDATLVLLGDVATDPQNHVRTARAGARLVENMDRTEQISRPVPASGQESTKGGDLPGDARLWQT